MFWALAICAFAYLAKSGRGIWWLAVGLFAGLGVVSKLTDLFLGLGILLCLFANADMRGWLANAWTWAGGLVAALVVAPMVLWNLDHDWVTFASQFSRLPPRAINPFGLPELIATQFALLNPPIAMFVGLAAVVWIGRRPSYPTRAIGLLMCTVVPLVAYMAFHSFHGQVQAHWLAPIFPTLVLAAAAAATAPPAERWAGLRAIAFPVGVGLSLIGLVLAANPYGVLPLRLDPGQMNHGWDGVAAEADRLRSDSGADWIAAANYAAHAIVAYNLRATGIPVIAVADRTRYAFAPPPEPGLLDRPALLIVNEASARRFAACFADMTPVGTIERKSGGATIETFTAYRVSGGRADLFQTGC
jgi:4-amino-4-deoxy-L-arabinose transferase-like glycosyltransferase